MKMSLGVAVGTLYAIPIAFSYKTRNNGKVLLISTICTSLVIVGYFMSPNQENQSQTVICNRIISILIIVIITWILYSYNNLKRTSLHHKIRYDELYNKSIIPMATTSLATGKIININEEGVKLFGYENKSEMINKVTTKTHYAESDGREELIKRIKRDGYVKNLELMFIDKQGRKIAVEASAKLFQKEGILEGAFFDVTEKHLNREKILNSNREKEILLKEIHHRVKNNLQIVWGMLDLQQNRMENKEIINALNDSKLRIKTISLLHEGLYKMEDYSNINFEVYLTNLLLHLKSIYNRADKMITIVSKIDHITVKIEKAIPLALIISEIVSNAFKYAYLDDDKGEIKLSFTNSNNSVYLCIEDNGCGFNVDNEYQTIGLELIKNLSDQIDAEIDIKSVIGEGTKYLIEINEG